MSSVKQTDKSRKKVLGFGSFFLLSMAGPLLMRVVNNTVNVGYAAIPLYVIDVLVYVIPYLFITIEFVSIKKIQGNESGYTAWISCAAGRKMGYLASGAYFFVNLFYFLSLVPDLITFLLVTITGDTNIMKEIIPDPRNQQLIITLLALAIFGLATFISMKGSKPLSIIGNYAGIGRLFIAVLFIIIGLVVTFGIINHGQPKTPFDADNFVGKTWDADGTAHSQDTGTLIGAMSGIIFSVGGQEVMATYINDTKDGVKTFIRVAIVSCSVSASVYILGTLVVGFVTSRHDMFINGISSGLLYAVSQLFAGSTVWALVATRIVGIFLCVGTMCTLLLWTAAPAKIFFSEIPEGVMGKGLARTDEDGTPFNALMLQGIIVTILFISSIIPVYAAGSSDPQEALNRYMMVLTGVTAATSELPMIMLFIAYIYFRVNHDDEERKFRFCHNRGIAIAFTLLMLAIFSIATITTVIPSPYKGQTDLPNAVLTFALGLGGMIIFMGFAGIMGDRYENRIMHGKIIDKQDMIKYGYDWEAIRKERILAKNKIYKVSHRISKLERLAVERESNLKHRKDENSVLPILDQAK